MEPKDYTLVKIEGEYAYLREINESNPEKDIYIALALLPAGVDVGFLRQEYSSGLPFPCLVDHVLSELSTMTHPIWVALHGLAHCFIELDKSVVHVINFVSFL